MKRIKEKVPGLDDIIFRDRNKEYGAYDLRRRYASTMSISLVAGLLIGASFFLVPYFTYDPVEFTPGGMISVVALPDPDLLTPPAPPEAPPAPKAPVEAMNDLRFVPPEVVMDELASGDGIMAADQLMQNITDGAATEVFPEDLTAEDPVVPVDPEPYTRGKGDALRSREETRNCSGISWSM